MTERDQRIMGFVGRSGSGKTTALSDLIPVLTGRGYTVSTVKHTHHDFDMDKPGKDSYRHREAGAKEVLLTSAHRWALLHELRGEPEFDMADLIGRMTPVDLLLIEGFKSHDYPKIEVHRPSLGKPLLAAHDDSVIAIATDDPGSGAITRLNIPVLNLGDADSIADFIVGYVKL